MSIFPRTFITGDNYNSSPSFHPLFRLLDDFDAYSQRDGGEGRQNKSASLARTFNPKFDVREVETGYELHGELPGIEQKDVEIEFTDSQTLNVRGRVEREYTSGEKPEETDNETKKIESHQPTVEDEPETGETAIQKTNENEKQVQQPQKPSAKYWVSERSVGSFARVFTFSQPIDHDNVKASMKNGLLSIFIPKKKAESRKIQIQ
jgi:HSP20 family protein